MRENHDRIRIGVDKMCAVICMKFILNKERKRDRYIWWETCVDMANNN